MHNFIQEVRMSWLARRATFALALSASAVSVVSVWLVPGSWPSGAGAVVACMAGLWLLQIMTRRERPILAVIAGVEAESPRLRVLAPNSPRTRS